MSLVKVNWPLAPFFKKGAQILHPELDQLIATSFTLESQLQVRKIWLVRPGLLVQIENDQSLAVWSSVNKQWYQLKTREETQRWADTELIWRQINTFQQNDSRLGLEIHRYLDHVWLTQICPIMSQWTKTNFYGLGGEYYRYFIHWSRKLDKLEGLVGTSQRKTSGWGFSNSSQNLSLATWNCRLHGLSLVTQLVDYNQIKLDFFQRESVFLINLTRLNWNLIQQLTNNRNLKPNWLIIIICDQRSFQSRRNRLEKYYRLMDFNHFRNYWQWVSVYVYQSR